MELKNFVKETLEQIVEGVSMAEEAINKKGGSINPSGIRFKKDGVWTEHSHAIPQNVIFNVGLTSTDKTGSSEGIGVFLGSISLGKKNDSGNEEVAVTKVQFAVPLALPPGANLKSKPLTSNDL
jgi:hypothetical protein